MELKKIKIILLKSLIFKKNIYVKIEMRCTWKIRILALTNLCLEPVFLSSLKNNR